MDPDQTLASLRSLTDRVLNNAFLDDDAGELLEEFAEKFDAIDAWLVTGGFKPHDWSGER